MHLHTKLSPILRGHIKLFQWLGTFNISLHPNPVIQERKERLLHAWSVLRLCCFTFVTIKTLLYPENVLFTRDKFGYFNDIFKLCIAQIVMTTIYLESMLKRENQRTFWRLYAELREQCSTLSLDDANWIAQLCTHFRFIFIFYGILLMDLVLEVLFLQESFELSFWLMFTPYIYMTHMQHMQIIMHIEIIRLELVKLEGDLALLADYTRFARRVVAFEDFEQFLRRRLIKEQLNYQRIYDMFDNFQRAFGCSMLAVLLMIYVRVLVDAYFMYYTKYIYEFYEYQNFLLFPSVLAIPALLITCKNCMNMVKYVTYQLHNIESRIGDTVISVQIQNFSLQLLHQKIRIDGMGITTLDGYMLSSIVGSVITYMIFFIQFMPKFLRI